MDGHFYENIFLCYKLRSWRRCEALGYIWQLWHRGHSVEKQITNWCTWALYTFTRKSYFRFLIWEKFCFLATRGWIDVVGSRHKSAAGRSVPSKRRDARSKWCIVPTEDDQFSCAAATRRFPTLVPAAASASSGARQQRGYGPLQQEVQI